MWFSIVKMTLRHKKHIEMSFQAVLLCLDLKKKIQSFVIFLTNETFL